MTKKEIVTLALNILNEACEENRYRDYEIMQGVDGENAHAQAVLSWVQKTVDQPSVALEVAAIFHDVDRVVNKGVGGGFKGDRNSPEYLEHKKAHAGRSADYVCPILAKSGVNSNLVERIKFLIIHHDDTGAEVEGLNDEEVNALVAADSLAFFTSVAPKLYQAEGEERLKDKIHFMIEKMPKSARTILSATVLENDIFERLKVEALKATESIR